MSKIINNRRRLPFVNHPIQIKYLSLVAVAMFVPAIVIGGCLYYLIWQTVAYQLAIPELIFQTLLPAYHRVNAILIIALPFVSVFIFLLAAGLSHRIAGPLKRIENELDTMIRTRNFTHVLKLRPGDELESLIEKINQAISAAQGKK